ncbi:hypothetical protein A2526_00170 [candidate division WOR-1 bacterium RIFOXYD2_FULL_36_8]|uniref:Uncharacterized protein n=1 Tax=candidate division WOR-1 bacterium RIFOXYB2_FULL_36_35 TaxID=1802578 RepID=A0A1F4RXT4_UNCSA|nr:MAG: hypothetical protein A2230_03340 [candidate division WOR-1 bacterium RIFOXYA2_FULL_36_21]OGC12980.1 MAG: hypothetical protein A2290_04940 [candidate division WOR-1 bacterium RIFOXYB2_FULL_36_35]OGC15194.1 MAG: hypothetical protein A2282_07540 [candidate division WOR-1 bacterium RIFOXYA12_FULL_36_13]OGC40056.1 MAG: hypothetical protein A2526_00170 [candidate division WOR-1 bacterium RIFOXYD2_FULL_36_8]
MFSLLVQRGCFQHCSGCHAGSYKVTSDASWDQTKKVVLGMESAMKKLEVEPDAPIIEVFRDGDPSWIRFPDHPQKGVGDLAKMLYQHLGRKSKVMTSGIRPDMIDWVIDQYVKGAPYFSSASVSASIQTITHIQDPDADVDSRARILDTFIQKNPSETQSYLDFMFYTPKGEDTLTKRTVQLVRKIIYASKLFPKRLAEIDFEQIDGTKNQKFMVGNVGLRASPFLSLSTYGRGVIKGGQKLDSVGITDWLSIVDGRDVVLQVGDEFFTRKELIADYDRRSFFIDGLRGLSVNNGWLIGDTAVPNIDEVFRTEFDITPALVIKSQRIGLFYQGLTLGPTINFLISNPARLELQEVLPWVRLNV